MLLPLLLVLVQGPTGRVEFGVEVVRAGPSGRRVVASGAVSGPLETALRLRDAAAAKLAVLPASPGGA